MAQKGLNLMFMSVLNVIILCPGATKRIGASPAGGLERLGVGMKFDYKCGSNPVLAHPRVFVAPRRADHAYLRRSNSMLASLRWSALPRATQPPRGKARI